MLDAMQIKFKSSVFCQGDMFRPYKVSLRPSKKTDPRVVYVSMHCGIPNAYKFLLEKCKIHKLVSIWDPTVH